MIIEQNTNRSLTSVPGVAIFKSLKKKKRHSPHDQINKPTRLEPIIGSSVRFRHHLSVRPNGCTGCWLLEQINTFVSQFDDKSNCSIKCFSRTFEPSGSKRAAIKRPVPPLPKSKARA
jgi:hypothetical protein